MRILLATAGSRGDVEPFVALAERARARGHEVRLVVPAGSEIDLTEVEVVRTGADFTQLIEQHGVSLAGVVRRYRSVVRPLMRSVIVDSARAALEHRPDLVVHHPKVLSAPLVAAALDVPHVRVETVPALTPTSAFPAAGTLTRGPRVLNRWTYRIGHLASAAFRSDLDEVRAMTGLRKLAPSAPVATLVPVSPAVLPRPDDWPDDVHLTGPWQRARTQPLDPAVAELVAAGPFLYVGFGSMAAPGAEARGRAVVDTVRRRRSRCLVVTGLGGIAVPASHAGHDVVVATSVPHDEVLPYATAAVHHGGIGTVHAALRAGTPSVLVPFAADQPFWAARLLEAGLAPAPLRRTGLSPVILGAALDEAELCRPRVRAAAAAMAAEDGVGRALEVLEAVC